MNHQMAKHPAITIRSIASFMTSPMYRQRWPTGRACWRLCWRR
jgi:hypothetical protein